MTLDIQKRFIICDMSCIRTFVNTQLTVELPCIFDGPHDDKLRLHNPEGYNLLDAQCSLQSNGGWVNKSKISK